MTLLAMHAAPAAMHSISYATAGWSAMVAPWRAELQRACKQLSCPTSTYVLTGSAVGRADHQSAVLAGTQRLLCLHTLPLEWEQLCCATRVCCDPMDMLVSDLSSGAPSYGIW